MNDTKVYHKYTFQVEKMPNYPTLLQIFSAKQTFLCYLLQPNMCLSNTLYSNISSICHICDSLTRGINKGQIDRPLISNKERS